MIDNTFLSFIFVWTICKSISVKDIDDKCIFYIFIVGSPYIYYSSFGISRSKLLSIGVKYIISIVDN